MNQNFKLISFKKALKSLQNASSMYRENTKNQVIEAGLIQNFEITIELAWKLMKKYLESENILAQTPRDSIKKSLEAGLINSGEIWLTALNDRNLTSHIYDEDQASEIAEKIINNYLKLFEQLEEKFSNLNS
jgi:nucleotidyltransferase substrate binding protein (TIGR01987 family)